MADNQKGDISEYSGGLATQLVQRSVVEDGLPYIEYREVLRKDFFYSCAYCTISESEGRGVGFSIDHYEPQSSRPDLANAYNNLLYSCLSCNRLKSDISPPDTARDDGLRYFRPDEDIFEDHFVLNGIRLEQTSKVGYFSVNALELNRQALTRLRGIRQRLSECEAHIAGGVLALRNFPIDRLPPQFRGRALRAINELVDDRESAAEAIDEALRDETRSELIDVDQNAKAERDDRRAFFRGMNVIHQGQWRSRRPSRS